MDGAPWRRGEHLGEEGRVDGAPWRGGSELSTLEGSTLEGSEWSTLEGSEWSTLERLYLGREHLGRE